MATEININIGGNFTNIRTRNEYCLIDKKLIGNMYEYTCKIKKRGNKQFSKTITLCGSNFILRISKSVYFQNKFIGNVMEVKGGFIPEGSVSNYHKSKIYKTFGDAQRYLINKRYQKIEKISFGLLAREKFYYTKNLLENLSINQMARLIEQFTEDFKLAVRIVKKFLQSDIIDYYGQLGYKTISKKVY